MSSNAELKKLSEVAGVDFIALREKYHAHISENSKSTENYSVEDVNARRQVDEKLSLYKICENCQGIGIVKSQYNFMVLEKTCEVCDGDSVILRETVHEIAKNVKCSQENKLHKNSLD